MANLDLKGVTKVYPGGVTAVTETSISIEDGEFIVLVDPSGCGKSTLLRMIAGLESITSGEIAIGGRRVNELEPGERDIAMVFQNYALYPHMSVYDNMAYGLRNQGMPKAEIDQRIQAAAETLHLKEYLDRKPRQLSGGQRQRVATGRAIVRDPQVFLFDEPLSNLDAKLRTHMRAELKELHTRLASTFIFVTHDQVEAMSLADRIIVLNDGHVEQIGRPMEIYDNPASLFVASFIGSPPTNIFPASSTAGEVLAAHGVGRADGAAWYGARPEDISLSAPEGAVLAGHLALREVLGTDVMIHVSLDGGSGAPQDRVIVRMSAEGHGELPDRVGLSFRGETVYAFDANEAVLPRP